MKQNIYNIENATLRYYLKHKNRIQYMDTDWYKRKTGKKHHRDYEESDI